jgi:energy-coupling factor transporter ATP-binding protein EcfA2
MPVLLLLKGHPGSGKSTLGRALASSLRWPLIDKDDGRNALQRDAALLPEVNTLAYDIMFNFLETQLACSLSAIVDCPMARLDLFERSAAFATKVIFLPFLPFRIEEFKCHGHLSISTALLFHIWIHKTEHFDTFRPVTPFPPFQHGAKLTLVECCPTDEALWAQRLDARGRADSGTTRAHKPGSWADLQAVQRRNAGSDRWSGNPAVAARLACHLEIDTTAMPLEEQVGVVTAALRGIAPGDLPRP